MSNNMAASSHLRLDEQKEMNNNLYTHIKQNGNVMKQKKIEISRSHATPQLRQRCIISP
jgi:hypothetical protein